MRNDPNVLRLVHIAIAAVFQVESLRLGTSFLRRGRLIFLFFDTGAKAFVWLPVFFATTFVWLPVFFATAFVWLPVFFTTPGFLVVVWLPVYFAAGFFDAGAKKSCSSGRRFTLPNIPYGRLRARCSNALNVSIFFEALEIHDLHSADAPACTLHQPGFVFNHECRRSLRF